MPELHGLLRGRVWKFGDSVDTNQLAGGGIVAGSAEETLRANCLRALCPEFPGQVQPGDIVVAGQNFGCGSSRQTAVEALRLCGVSAVVAESVARIHRRNSVALGFPIFTVPGVTDVVSTGDIIEIDYETGVIRVPERPGRPVKQLTFDRFPAFVEEIYAAGGILPMLAQGLAEIGIKPDDQ